MTPASDPAAAGCPWASYFIPFDALRSQDSLFFFEKKRQKTFNNFWSVP
jgi:hypothetical protein